MAFKMIGKVAHIGLDLVLVTGFLAGVKRNTGLHLNVDKLENENVRYYTNQYLNFGEKIFDYSTAYLNSSDYFTRK